MASRQKLTTPPRRLPPEERREQLAGFALEVAAERGYQGLELEEVAERAGVARSLLYRYFPEGRRDLYLAAVHQAGQELAGDWITDESIPLDQRLARNFARIIDHAAEPSDAWRLYRQAQSSADPEVVAIGRRYHGMVVESVCQNHLGTGEPPELVRLALLGYLAYAETALDAWRESDLARETITELLSRTLVTTIEAAVALAASS
jgi:AcrR family transcriptional regulator